MAKNQTFSVSLNLLTKNFEKGINGIKSSLNKLKGQFTNFIGGIGIGLGFKELVDSARKLDKAQAVLRNVSEDTRAYANNLSFVNELSSKYNQELTTLMGNYAKFYSISSNSNLSLEQSKHVFEALTRASSYFNLSADEFNSVMLATNQMMSKGKVSSEEFTRQLSERLPGTLNLVAEKYDVTAGEMLKMIQNGEVMAEDLLPKLAEGLNSLTTNLDVNTVEGAIARMRNSFTSLVSKMGVGDIYKKVINAISKSLEYVSDNFDRVKDRVLAIVGAIASQSLVTKMKENWGLYFAAIGKDIEALNAKARRLQGTLINLENKKQIKFDFKDGKVVNLENLAMSEKAFAVAQMAAEDYNDIMEQIMKKDVPNVDFAAKLKDGWKDFTKSFKTNMREISASFKGAWNEIQNFSVKDVFKNIGASIKEIWKSLTDWRSHMSTLGSAFSTAINGMYAGFQRLGVVIRGAASMKALLASYWPMLAIYGITRVIQEWKNWRKEVERVKNLIVETNNALDDRINKKSRDEEELLLLQKNLATEKVNIGADPEVLKAIINQLNKLLNTNFDSNSSYKEINEAINERLGLLKTERTYQEQLAELSEQRIKKEQAQRDLDKLREKKADAERVMNTLPAGGGAGMQARTGKAAEINILDDKIELKLTEIGEIDKIIKNLEESSLELSKTANQRQAELEKTPPPDSTKILEEEYDKIKSEYNNSLRALDDQLRDNTIKQEEYDKSLKSLILSTLSSIYALNDIDENSEEFAKALRDAARKYISNEVLDEYQKIQKEYNDKLRALTAQKNDDYLTDKEYQEAIGQLTTSTLESIYALNDIDENASLFAKELRNQAMLYKVGKDAKKNPDDEAKSNKALYEYYTKTLELANQLDNGLITYEEYQDALVDLKEETLKNLSAIGELSDAAEELAASYEEQRKLQANRKAKEIQDVNFLPPQAQKRDTFFDYKKTTSEIAKENADLWRDEIDNLEETIEKFKELQKENPTEKINSQLEELSKKLAFATQEAETFEQAAKFAEVQEDVKNMKMELAQGIFDNISGIASAAERLTNSFKSLQETWDDPDASGWEKFITTFTTIISVIETIVSVVKTFNAAMKVAEALSLATAAAEQTQIPVKVQDAIATKAQAAAAKELAVARHMSAAASVPYPANLAAIASTSAALAAAFAAIPQFAKGGLVAGSSTQGDRNLVRVNSGEMILTKGQQGTLWSMLNGKASTGSGNVNFEIRGDKLVGVLNNYSKKISK